MEYIVITPDLDIRWEHLMLKVDFSRRFTLWNLLEAAVNSSEIDVDIMSRLVRCRCLVDIYEEAASAPYEPLLPERVEFLQLTWMAETFFLDDGNLWHNNFWDMSGANNTNADTIGIDMAPTYRLTELPIRLNRVVEIHEFGSEDVRIKFLRFRPNIALLELLHTVYWHLALFGGPKQREDVIDEFVAAVRGIYLQRNARQIVAPLKKTVKEVG